MEQHKVDFATIRSILQGEHTCHTWSELTSAYHKALQVKNVRMYNQRVSAEGRDFIARYEPYIMGELERWPDDLRVVGWHHVDALRRLARVMSFDMRYVNSKRDVDSTVEGVKAHAYPECTGIEIAGDPGVGSYGDYCFSRMSETLAPNLERVWLRFEDKSGRKRGYFGLDSACDLLASLCDAHGQTLHDLSLGYGHGVDSGVLWDVVMSQAERFGALKSLRSFTQVNDRRGDVMSRVFEHPSLQGLSDLSWVPNASQRVDVEAFLARPGASALRRVSLMGLSEQDIDRLLIAPECGGVTHWELSKSISERHPFRWDSERASLWSRRRGVLRDLESDQKPRLLEQSHVSLEGLIPQDMLCDEDGALHQADQVESLHFGSATALDVDAFFAQVQSAMPNLKKLDMGYFKLSMPEFEALAVEHAAFIEQLDEFSIYVERDNSRLIPFFQNKSHPQLLRRHAWDMFSRSATTKRELVMCLAMLGKTCSHSMTSAKLRALLNAERPEDLGVAPLT